MADPVARAIITWDRVGGEAEDRIVNVMHFQGDDSVTLGDRERWDNLAIGLTDRLQTWVTALHNNVHSKLIEGTGTIRLYDLTDPMPRQVRHEESFSNAGALGDPLPAECCAVVTLHTVAVSGQPIARRRGRVYIGPIRESLTDWAAGLPDVIITDAGKDPLLDAFEDMALGTDGAFRLAVFSPTTYAATNSYADAFNDVDRVSVDNAVDIQRRRGAAPTGRLFRNFSG